MHRQRQAFCQRKRSVKEEEETEEFEEEGSKEDGEKAPAAKRRKVPKSQSNVLLLHENKLPLWLSYKDKPIKAGPPPLDLSFWSFLTFLHHGIEEVERHLL